MREMLMKVDHFLKYQMNLFAYHVNCPAQIVPGFFAWTARP